MGRRPSTSAGTSRQGRTHSSSAGRGCHTLGAARFHGSSRAKRRRAASGAAGRAASQRSPPSRRAPPRPAPPRAHAATALRGRERGRDPRDGAGCRQSESSGERRRAPIVHVPARAASGRCRRLCGGAAANCGGGSGLRVKLRPSRGGSHCRASLGQRRGRRERRRGGEHGPRRNHGTGKRGEGQRGRRRSDRGSWAGDGPLVQARPRGREPAARRRELLLQRLLLRMQPCEGRRAARSTPLLLRGAAAPERARQRGFGGGAPRGRT